MRVKLPHLRYEKRLWERRYFVIGVDEVGRGALAGSLTVGAVCFKPTRKRDEIKLLQKSGINDSKKVYAKKREKLADFIRKNSLHFTTSSVAVSFINKHGIAKATRKAMRHAIGKIMKKLKEEKVFILVDGFHIKYLRGIRVKNQPRTRTSSVRGCPEPIFDLVHGQKAIVHGDQISLSIAAASIIAKVERDAMMIKLSQKYPRYKWARNKGYGTKTHRAAIKKHGPTRLHRTLFIRKYHTDAM